MEIKIKNCQVVNINAKTHTVLLASKEDLSNAQKIIDEFFSRFEIIKIIPLVASKELIQPQKIDLGLSKTKFGNKLSVVGQYLQIKESLREVFTANDYYDALKTIGIDIQIQSVYYQLHKLQKKGKITINNHTTPITYQKIHIEPEPMPQMREERKNLINSTR